MTTSCGQRERIERNSSCSFNVSISSREMPELSKNELHFDATFKAHNHEIEAFAESVRLPCKVTSESHEGPRCDRNHRRY
jgi:hypothetical protein